MEYRDPDVSILIPTYKRFNKLKQLLMTIYPHIGEGLEVIVGNDNPDDFKKIASFISKLNEGLTNPIKLLSSPTNQGIYLNRANLVHHSSGEIIIFCDDDDYLNMAVIKEAMDEYYYAGLMHSAYLFNVLEFYHNLKDGSNQVMNKFKRTYPKTGKVVAGVSGTMFDGVLLRKHLEGYREFLSSLDLSKVIGDDQVFYYYFSKFFDRTPTVFSSVLYIANYDKSEEHIMFTDPKETTVENVNKYKIWYSPEHLSL